MSRKWKWPISLVLIFTLLFSAVLTAAATEPDGPDVRSTVMADTESEGGEGTEEKMESETAKKTESDSKKDAEDESETERNAAEASEKEIQKETERENGDETETETVSENSLGNSNDEPPADAEDPGSISCEGVAPDAHEHSWSADWGCDESFHWHECEARDCPETVSSEKNGYGEHNLRR